MCTLSRRKGIEPPRRAGYAAGAVLPEHTVVPPRTLWAGVPGKLRRELCDADRALIREYAQNYLDYTEVYLAETGQAVSK